MAKIDIPWAAAATVLARVLDINGEAAKIFKQDFGVKAAVAAGPAGGDEDLARRVWPTCELRRNLRL